MSQCQKVAGNPARAQHCSRVETWLSICRQMDTDDMLSRSNVEMPQTLCLYCTSALSLALDWTPEMSGGTSRKRILFADAQISDTQTNAEVLARPVGIQNEVQKSSKHSELMYSCYPVFRRPRFPLDSLACPR